MASRRRQARPRACAAAASGMVATASGAVAWARAAHRLRSRTPGKRLVGWRGRTPRLLRAGNRTRPARLGIRATGRAGQLDAAWVVRMKQFHLPLQAANDPGDP